MLAVFAFAPERLWPLAFPAVALLLHAVDRPRRSRRAFLNAFLFGCGLYTLGVGWMYVSLNRYGGMSPPLAGIATLIVCLWMAGGLGLAALVGRWASRRIADRFLRLLVLAAVWSLLETVARAALPLGFPWISLGHAQAPDGPLAGYVPLVGAQGVSVLVAMLAAALAAPFGPTGKEGSRPWLAPAAVALACLAGGLAAGQMEHTAPAGGPISVSLLQGNIPQDHKWVAANREPIVAAYDELVGRAEGRLVVMPETALPVIWEDVGGELLDRWRARGARDDGAVIAGALELNDSRTGLHNSAIALGAFEDRIYRKVELAPFGEFVPFGFILAAAARLLDIPYSELVPGDGEAIMELPFGEVIVAICYEDAFPGVFAGPASRSAFLVNMTNAAWFGETRMREQHLQISQARSLETGREMVRSTNTGLTAHVGHRGEVLALLPRDAEGILEAGVTPREGATPFVRMGFLLLALGVAAVLAAALALRGR